ncbi:restriction endonuclease subunit S [Polaribacter ponticola]|uniref:Restriction endonuclease subunit S n=1 Tax=Polaribacter ponticola TaxID=2978475 RepID=A0ABT5SBM5_9FLAO|nr:restriction endonuclease subunit S [Polaribacter sp. MSW5]MDD7915483.1 restriction endonuclease subunit S [Polaribacter sp. MSW5]
MKNVIIENTKGFKETKLGWIPEDWDIIKLEDIGHTVIGLTYNPQMVSEEGMLVLRSSNVQDRALKFEDNVYVDVNENKFNKTKTGDILICVRNGSRNLIGKNAIIDEASAGTAFGAFMLVFRSSDYKFLYQLFDTAYYGREIHRNLGATINSINTKNLKQFRFPFPKKKERMLISTCLSTWDTALTNLNSLIKAKQKLKKGLMQQLLSGKKRLPGFEQEWETWSFEELFKKVSRPVNWNDEETYDLISVRRRSGGLFHRDSLKGSQILTKKLYIAKKGDFLISKMQILHGASGLVNDKFDGMKISGSYIAVVPKNDTLLNMKFMEWYSKTPKFYHQTFRSSYGVHIEKMTFNYKLFEKEEIILPPLKEQNAITKVLNTSDKEIELLTNQRNQLQLQKKD